MINLNCYCIILVVAVLISFSAGQSDGNITCPVPADYRPCTCNDYGDGTIDLNCNVRNLNDVRASRILSAFLLTPGVSPVTALYLFSNQLTKIPGEIAHFNQLRYLSFGSNQITSVTSGAFNFSATTVKSLWLYGNQLTSIDAGVLEGGYENRSFVFLQDNNLTRFEYGVFQSVLQQMVPYGGHPNAYIDLRNNPINCDAGSCHLAWLVRDNPRLMRSVYGAQCSNGTPFDQLESDAFKSCPSQANGSNELTTTRYTVVLLFVYWWIGLFILFNH